MKGRLIRENVKDKYEKAVRQSKTLKRQKAQRKTLAEGSEVKPEKAERSEGKT